MGAPMLGPEKDKAVYHTRRTRSGRHLTYRLAVIQEPERARACGSGPKSSADRRPVDPPPVVELKVFEGDYDQGKDITFNYNANFFLFATLEHARQIAHGRVQTPAANTPPVLTGMPVSGMAYLDRPQEAGYFLFPDLSVRHEGRYRLTFNLYEETKEDKDKDELPPTGDAFPGGSFDWRMEVKSADFTVYSAKKFPGLAESTNLSRTVAEQGCRVRIRRDVRMRRRDGKPSAGGGGGGDFDNGNAEDEYARHRRTQTPEIAKQQELRARSMSGSIDGGPYSAEPQRRPSGAEYQPPPPGFPSSQAPSTSHLTFGNGHFSNPPQYGQPNSGRASPVSQVPQSPTYPSSQSGYPPPQSAYRQPRSLTPVHTDRIQPQNNVVYAHHPSPKRDVFGIDSRRLSNSSLAPRPDTPQSAHDRDSFSGRLPCPQSIMPSPVQSDMEAQVNQGNHHTLPSFRDLCGNRDENDRSRATPAIPSPASDRDCRSSISVEQPPRYQTPHLPPPQLYPPARSQLAPAPAPVQEVTQTSRKRPYSQAYPAYEPAISYHGSKDRRRPEEDVLPKLIDTRSMVYARADGTMRERYFLKWDEPPSIPQWRGEEDRLAAERHSGTK